MYREALRINQATLPPDDPSIGRSMAHLGTLMRSQQKFPEADECSAIRSGAVLKTQPPEDPDVLLAVNSLGAVVEQWPTE